MKRLLTLTIILFTLTTTAQVLELPGVSVEQDTVYFDLTPYMGMYVTDAELQSAIDLIPFSDSVAIIPQDLADYFDFAINDSAYIVLDGLVFDTTFTPVGDTFARVYMVQYLDTVYFKIDPLDWQNFLKWFNEYRTPIFPTNYDYGWGEIIE